MESIRALRTILNESLDTLEAAFVSKSLDFPALDEPYNASTESEKLYISQEVQSTVSRVVAASYQLLCTVRHPFLNVADAATGYYLAACLGVAEKFNIPEILKDSGDLGLNVNEIANEADIEPTKLARILRVLATHHIFREVQPNVFCNNRTSSYFSTSKSAEDIRLDPLSKYFDSSDSAAAGYIGTFTDDVFKSASYLLEDLEDPQTGKEFSATGTAFQKAMSTDKNYFAWIEQPGNERRFTRYGACIQGTSLWPQESIVDGYDWNKVIQEDGLVVDVGGGIGAPAMTLAKTFPKLRITLEDRSAVVHQAQQFWKNTYPNAVDTNRVSFLAHDFFLPQPVKNASVFLVRMICHDWPDELVIKILSHLRVAAQPSTKLIIADFIMPYACPSTDSVEAPAPLLANLGKASFNAYFVDITMQVLLNGQERTLPHQNDLADKSGWKIVQVNRVKNSAFGYMIAEPA